MAKARRKTADPGLADPSLANAGLAGDARTALLVAAVVLASRWAVRGLLRLLGRRV